MHNNNTLNKTDLRNIEKCLLTQISEINSFISEVGNSPSSASRCVVEKANRLMKSYTKTLIKIQKIRRAK